MSPFIGHPYGLSAATLELLDQGLTEIWREMQAAADGQPIKRSAWMSKRTQPKFKIGQEVSYSPAKLSMPAPSRSYKIIRPLPREGGEFMYRIKSAGEVFERVARESEIKKVPSVPRTGTSGG